MTKFIVNKGPNTEVHRTVQAIKACNIDQVASHNRIDNDENYPDLYPSQYDSWKQCYTEKHQK